ncbi:MAG: acyl-CoA dehydrogenase, partial [Ferruginibacter sp.]|nr:acyl-CoA dehydrogenase [Rhodoferax sp.]
GFKAWCSGAATASHGLLTAWYPDGSGPQLVQVEMRQPGVFVFDQHWCAVGMHASASLDISFRRARGSLIGCVGDYLARPGFWQGGAGIAACWFGGSLAIASALRESVCQSGSSAAHPFRLAALGKVDLALQSTAALLRQAAQFIDEEPLRDASLVALRVRQSAEQTARYVLDQVLQALGATPLCKDRYFARMAADLPVFIRQSHAERDFAAMGERLCKQQGDPWML